MQLNAFICTEAQFLSLIALSQDNSHEGEGQISEAPFQEAQ